MGTVFVTFLLSLVVSQLVCLWEFWSLAWKNIIQGIRGRESIDGFMPFNSIVKGFISVGASYVVNLRCVQSILQTELIMINGQSIPIPRRLRNVVKEQYFDFYREEAMKK